MTEPVMWEILVPYKIGKKTVQVPYHQEWDAKVVEIAGGLTIMRAARGQWVSPTTGKKHKEIMIPVRIVCKEDQIKEIMCFTLQHYKQEAVLAYQVSTKVLMVHNE